jgi:DNA-binding response OmpR family regulator
MPTLVVDSNGAAAKQLAEQLNHSGFQADIALSCHEAHTMTRAKRFGTLVVVADLALATDLECLTRLRATAPRVWIIVISAQPHPNAQEAILRVGADSLLVAPFSVRELTFRLSAFSRRSRPF